MVNTLNNSPEKVPSKGGNKFKKAIALAIALTLSGQPAEGKTYEKQEFPTEMVANNPGEVSLINENIEQTSVPNYINRAQNGVRKYYPQYEEYFRTIFNRINGLKPNSKNLINSKIKENFDTFSDELSSNQDKTTTIILVLEEFIGQTNFKKAINITDDDIRLGIAQEITYDLKIQIKKELKESRKDLDNSRKDLDNSRKDLDNSRKDLDNSRKDLDKIKKRNNMLKEIINTINSSNKSRETTENILLRIEDYFNLFDVNEIKNDEGLQKIIKQYITLNKQINRTPSYRGKIFIEEYKKISAK